jgi:16S rRNA (cytosine967-C5)-methyltransferase|tara:strand:- start:181 stop:1485 length:1305 start_codon:yes stop_codon:yes gene_type:complete
MSRDVRASAAQLLAKVTAGASLNTHYEQAADQLETNQRAFFRELIYGSLRWWPYYRGIYRQLVNKPMKTKDSDIEALLILGLYELDHGDTPDYASVSAAVNSVNALKKKWAKGLVNGCLRRYQREGARLQESLNSAEKAAYPLWLYDKIRAEWPEHCETIVEASRQKPPMSLRINRQQVSLEEYKEQLTVAEIPVRRGGAFGVTLETACNVEELPRFFEGYCSIQDESAQWAAPSLNNALNHEEGMRVLDACAAPGGKACHLAELGASVVAMDISQERLEKVTANRDRLKLKIDIEAHDARSGEHEGAEFDGILLDVPCSATGVVRRNPDVKLIRTPEDIVQFSALQQELLTALWPRLKPGGHLLYVTCSILRGENDDVIGQFLANTSDVTLETLSSVPGEATSYGVQLIPNSDGGDGLYYSLLKKPKGSDASR